ncbi:MAG: hypothetical protein ACRER2_14560 [Methylococcales bacterium]
MLSQSELFADLSVIEIYGRRFPDEWIGVSFESDHPDRIQALFTAHVEQHRAALLAKVGYPDRLDVRQGCYSKKDLDAIRADVERRVFADPRRLMRAVGSLITSIEIELTAQGEDLAAQLWEQYGDALDISVGAFPYPPSRARLTDAKHPLPDCRIGEPLPPTKETIIPGLKLRVVLDQPSVPSGADFKAKLVARNTGSTRIHREIEGDPLTAMIVRPGTRDIVGVHYGFIGGMGAAFRLAPGGQQQFAVQGGTASCDLQLGYAVPPGQYAVIVTVRLYNSTPGQPIAFVISPETPIRVE